MNRRDQMAALSNRMNASLGVGVAPAEPAEAKIEPTTSGKLDGTKVDRQARLIAVDRIEPDPDQPRRKINPEQIEHLARSLEAEGQLQAIRVRWSPERGKYVIIAGERRWQAARHSGKIPELRAHVVEGDQDADRLLQEQLVENLQREDLDPIDQAQAFNRLMQRKDWSARHLAEELHLSHTHINRTLELLDQPESIRELVRVGKLAPSVAYEISKLDDAQAQEAMAEQVVQEAMTREQVVEAVGARKSSDNSKRAKSGGKSRGASRVPKKVLNLRGGKLTLERSKGVANAEFLDAAIAVLRAYRDEVAPAEVEAEEGGVAPGLEQEHGQAA